MCSLRSGYPGINAIMGGDSVNWRRVCEIDAGGIQAVCIECQMPGYTALMRAVRFKAGSQRHTLACTAYARIEHTHTPRVVLRTSVTNEYYRELCNDF